MEKGKRRREEREAKARKVDDVEKDESLQAMALGSLEAFITHSEALDEQSGMGLGLMEESTRWVTRCGFHPQRVDLMHLVQLGILQRDL